MVLAVLTVRRLYWPLAGYGIGIVVLTVDAKGIFFTKPRFLLVGAVALLLPVAIGLASRRLGTVIAVATAIVLGCAWFSAYWLAGWPRAI